MPTRTIEVNKSVLNDACKRLLARKPPYLADYESRVAAARESYCAMIMNQKTWIFFGPKHTKYQALESWNRRWDSTPLKDRKSDQYSDDTHKVIQNLKNERIIVDRKIAAVDELKSIAWKLQKLVIATSGPNIRITADDFDVIAPFIREK